MLSVFIKFRRKGWNTKADSEWSKRELVSKGFEGGKNVDLWKGGGMG